MGFAPTWLCQVSPPPPLHMTTLTTGPTIYSKTTPSPRGSTVSGRSDRSHESVRIRALADSHHILSPSCAVVRRVLGGAGFVPGGFTGFSHVIVVVIIVVRGRAVVLSATFVVRSVRISATSQHTQS